MADKHNNLPKKPKEIILAQEEYHGIGAKPYKEGRIKETDITPSRSDGVAHAVESVGKRLNSQGVTPAPETAGIEHPSVPQAGGKASGKVK